MLKQIFLLIIFSITSTQICKAPIYTDSDSSSDYDRPDSDVSGDTEICCFHTRSGGCYDRRKCEYRHGDDGVTPCHFGERCHNGHEDRPEQKRRREAYEAREAKRAMLARAEKDRILKAKAASRIALNDSEETARREIINTELEEWEAIKKQEIQARLIFVKKTLSDAHALLKNAKDFSDGLLKELMKRESSVLIDIALKALMEAEKSCNE